MTIKNPLSMLPVILFDQPPPNLSYQMCEKSRQMTKGRYLKIDDLKNTGIFTLIL